MANRYLKTAGGNWSAAATWSATGAAGVDSVGPPTAADDCILELVSGNLTIDAGAVCRSLDTTSGTGSYGGTITHTAAVTLTIGDATAGAGNVAFKLNSGVTYTLGNAATSAISFVSTSATQQTITTGGKTLGNWTVNGAGSSYLLSDANTTGATATVTLTAGTLNTNGQACSWGIFNMSNSNTRTITLGASAITITGASTTVWSSATATGLTITANTATITLTGATATINTGAVNMNGASVIISGSGTATYNGSGSTWVNLTRTGTAVKTDAFTIAATITITGTLTLTGNSAVNRLLVQSSTFTAVRTITAAAVSIADVDFNDIIGAGAASPFTGTSLGDASGNSGITFDSPTTQTHTTSAGGNWSDVTKWTSRVPLPQDNVAVDSNTTGTLTLDMPRAGANLDFTGFTGTLAASSLSWAFYGNLTLASGMTFTPGTQSVTANGRGTHTITSAGKSFYNLIVNSAIASVYTFADAVTCTDTALTLGLTVQRGTVTWQGNVTASVFLSGSANSKTFNMGSGTWSLTGTSGTLWSVAGSPVVINANTSTIAITNASTSARTFAGGGQTFNNLTYTVDNSPGSLTITGTNTFATLNVDSGKILTMPSATTNTITNTFNVNGGVNGYWYSPGVLSNFASTPDSAAVSITGDIDIRAKITPLTGGFWNAQDLQMGTKYNGAGFMSWLFEIVAGTGIRLRWSIDGSTLITPAGQTITLATGVTGWLRATLDVNNGAGGYTLRYYQSLDGAAWTQLGADIIGGAPTSIFDSTTVFEMGTRNAGIVASSPAYFHRVQIRNNILDDGTGIVFDADFTTKPVGANTFTESSANAATVTINGTLAQAGDGRVSLVSSTPGSPATLTKSTGVVSCDYLSIQDSTATGGAKWYAGANSVNVSGNTGWIFAASNPDNPNANRFFGVFE